MGDGQLAKRAEAHGGATFMKGNQRKRRSGPRDDALACEGFRPGFCEAAMVDMRDGRRSARKLL